MCTRVPFFGKMESRYGVQQDPHNVHTIDDMQPPNNKKDFQSFLSIMNYLWKISPAIAEVRKPFEEFKSARVKCVLNRSYQKLYENAKSLIKAKACIKFCNK